MSHPLVTTTSSTVSKMLTSQLVVVSRVKTCANPGFAHYPTLNILQAWGNFVLLPTRSLFQAMQIS